MTQGKYLTQVLAELHSLLGGLVSDADPGEGEAEPKRCREGGERAYIQAGRERDPALREDAIKACGWIVGYVSLILMLFMALIYLLGT